MEDLHELRERVAVTEATLKAHREMLEEVRDAVNGINASLHTLTRLEERALAHQEGQSTTRQMVLDEATARGKKDVEHESRLENIELILGNLSTDTRVNSHNREFFEKNGPLILAALLGPITALVLALLVYGLPTT